MNNKAPTQVMGYKNNVLLFTHERIIQIKSNFNPTCTYGQTLSFLYDKKNPTEKRSLDFSTDTKGSQSAGDALQKLLEKRKKVILPEFREFPFKALSDKTGSSLISSVSHVTIRSIHRDAIIENLHDILDISILSSNRSTSSKTNSYHSVNGDTGDEEQTSTHINERHDGGEDAGGDDIENPEVQPQDDDNEPDYSIESIDCIESQHSGEDYDLDIGTGQRPQDHSHDSEQVAAHDRGPLMPPGATGAAQRSICEEVNESDDSPEAGSPLCGAAVARRPTESAASKHTRGSKGTKGSKVKPTITVSIHAPRMRDMNRSSAPSTNIPTKLPFQAAEDESDKQ